MRQGLVFSSRTRRNRRARRSAKARRTARRVSRRSSRRESRRLHFFGVLKHKQRGGNYAYRIPGDATRGFQRREDDGFSQPIMATQDEIARIAESEDIVS